MSELNRVPVSVIIPCFNHGKYIHQALESIFSQTFKVAEIIIVDDGSTEVETIDILKRIINPIVRVYFNPNRGVSAARNFGFATAINEYIVTIDSDDYFAPTFIEKAVRVIESSSGIGAVSCWAQCFDQSKTLYRYEEANLFDYLIKNRTVNAAIIRKSVWKAIGQYDESMLEGLEDWDFWIKLKKHGHDIHIIPQPLFYYRIKTASRNQHAMLHHEKMYRELLTKHQDIFTNNFPDALLYIIKRKDEVLQKMLHSTTYKLGSLLLAPAIFIRTFFKK